MQRRKFSREFKVEAVKLVRDRGVSMAQAARDLDLHINVLRKWVGDHGADPSGAFPGHGRCRPNCRRSRPRLRTTASGNSGLSNQLALTKRGGSVCLHSLARLLSGAAAGFMPLREAVGWALSEQLALRLAAALSCSMKSPFRYFNSSPEVIRLVVMMYVKYPLSLRNVEDLLAERGID